MNGFGDLYDVPLGRSVTRTGRPKRDRRKVKLQKHARRRNRR